MGLAKYMEDNIEIFNNRMYKKGVGIVELKDLHEKHKRESKLVSLEEEYISTLNEIEKVKIWQEQADNIRSLVSSKSIIEVLDRQDKHLNRVKDEYIDYKFDPKFRNFRDKNPGFSAKDLKMFERLILENYLELLVDNLKEAENVTNDDGIQLNFLYLDIEVVLKEYFQFNQRELEIPLIQYIREEILQDHDKPWKLCSHCEKKTYRDFKTCINCKYPNEVK